VKAKFQDKNSLEFLCQSPATVPGLTS